MVSQRTSEREKKNPWSCLQGILKQVSIRNHIRIQVSHTRTSKKAAAGLGNQTYCVITFEGFSVILNILQEKVFVNEVVTADFQT